MHSFLLAKAEQMGHSQKPQFLPAGSMQETHTSGHPILKLQQTIGNKAASRVIQAKLREKQERQRKAATDTPELPGLSVSKSKDEENFPQQFVLSASPAKVVQRLPAAIWGKKDASVSTPPDLIQSHLAKNIDISVSGVTWRWVWGSEWNIYDAYDQVIASKSAWKYPDFTLEKDVVKKGTPSDGKGNPWTARFEVTETGYPFGGDDPDNFPWGEAHFHVYASPIANAKFDKKEEIGNQVFAIDKIEVGEGETGEYSVTASGSETRTDSSSVTITNTAKISGEREESASVEYKGIDGDLKNKIGFGASGSIGFEASRSIAKMTGETLSQTQTLTRVLNKKNLAPGTHTLYLRPVFLVLSGTANVLSQNKGVVSKASETTGSIRIWKGYSLEAKIDRAGGGNPVLNMSPEEFKKDKDAQKALFAMAKAARDRQQSFADKLLAENGVKGGKAKSILKRDNLDEFVEGIVAKCKRNGYTRIGEMDDIIRGRFDLRTNQDVDTIAVAIKNQSKYRVKLVVTPRRPQKGGGYGYPRWHIIVRDPDTDLTHEWQVGTLAVTEVYETKGIDVPEEMKDDVKKGKIKNDLHDIEYDIFQQIKRKYPKVHEQYGLQAFHDKVDQVSAEAGLKGEKTADLQKKINQLHKEAAEYLKKLVKEFGIDWIRQFYH